LKNAKQTKQKEHEDKFDLTCSNKNDSHTWRRFLGNDFDWSNVEWMYRNETRKHCFSSL